MNNSDKIIIDGCGGTGSWSRPYREAGYDGRLIDLPTDIRLLQFEAKRVHGILLAPPCTRFSFARNRYPPSDEELKDALSIVDACLRMIVIYKPVWWALENPRAKLRRYLGPARLEFYQWEFGDPGHKPTCLWGDFTPPAKTPAERTKPSIWMSSKPNASKKDQVTPAAFAQAFFKANP